MNRLSWALLGLLVGASACGDETPTIVEVEAAFTGSCVFSACHQGASPAGNLSLESPVFAKIVDVSSTQVPAKVRVKPGDVAGSYLMDKILGVDGIVGERMPTTAPLSDERTDLIRRWIEAGAPQE